MQRYQHIQLKDKGLSARVVWGIHTLLSNCLEQAVAERLILANPTKGCKLPKLEKKEMKILPQEKIGPYFMEADKRGLLAAFYLELTTGLRRGELLSLLWTDLDVENKTISVTKQVSRLNGKLVVSQPKTQNSIRTLAIPQQAVDLLVQEHQKHPGNPYMFPSPKTGTMFDPDGFRHTHDKILNAIGAEHIRLHDLRHTFATLSLKSGENSEKRRKKRHRTEEFLSGTARFSLFGVPYGSAFGSGETGKNSIQLFLRNTKEEVLKS